MKILALLFFFISLNSFGATCTTTTRSNYSTGQTLTSSALNADFNQLVAKSNAMDAGCLIDGSLEKAALNSTEFSALNNGIHQGCAVAYSDANTVVVDKCILSVNGNFVKTTLTGSVTWGCPGCSGELPSTLYYVYAKADSISTTLNLLISSTVPGADGYDGSGNKVLGKFYNNSSSAIIPQSVFSWGVNGFALNSSSNTEVDTFSFNYYGGGPFGECASGVCTLAQVGNKVTSVTRTGTGSYSILFARTYTLVFCFGVVDSGVEPGIIRGGGKGANTNTISITTKNQTGPYASADSFGVISCWGH
jgi:hypothetical protein